MMDAALRYANDLGFSVIPCGVNKKALVPWEPYQKKIASDDEIKGWFRDRAAQVAIVTGQISNLAVIDLDDVATALRALEPLVSDSLDFPIATTPSGGQHWYFTCPGAKLSNNTKAIPGADLRANGGYVLAPPSRTPRGAYAFRRDNLAERPALPEAYLAAVAKRFTSVANHPEPLQSVAAIQQGKRDDFLFHIANTLVRGGSSAEEVRNIILHLGATYCSPPMPERDCIAKVESAIKRRGNRDVNIMGEIESFIMESTGAFTVQDVMRTLEEYGTGRSTVRSALKRLKDRGTIRIYGDKDGSYVRIDGQADRIDWRSADDRQLPVRYPLGIEELVHTYPKNIMVVAGEPNAGKTALLLNFAYLNAASHMPIKYFSSEMGAVELKTRLMKSDADLDVFDRIEFLERSEKFEEVIDPDGINIIDYLEMSDSFYQVAGIMRMIHDRLRGGICMIAIQKDRAKDFGRGGTMGLEKPRLYMNLSPNLLKIVKAKSWANPDRRPDGLECRFKLYHGYRLRMDDAGWTEPIKGGR